MPDPFGTLPLPLPTFIFHGIEDLGTLHCLLQASPAANPIFSEHYCEITESILSNFLPQLQQLLRIIVSIRSQPSSVRAQCSSTEGYNAFRARNVLSKDAGANPLCKSSASLAAVRSLARTASQVQSLMASFFMVHLERVNELQPYRCLKEGRHYKNQWVKMPSPDVQRYEQVRCEEPSWVEEQRVLRALWRIIFSHDLLIILRLYEGQKPEDWVPLANERFPYFWSRRGHKGNPVHGLLGYALQEIDCVLDFLAEKLNTELGSEVQWKDLGHLLMAEADHFVAPQPTPCHYNDAIRDLQRPPSDLNLDRQNPGYFIFQACQTYRTEKLCSLAGLDFRPFRCLGLGIWDDEKMARLGLCLDLRQSDTKSFHTYSKVWIWELCLRWRSLLLKQCGLAEAM